MAFCLQFYNENGPKKRDNIVCTVLIFYVFRILFFQAENPLFPRLGPNIWAKLWLQISLGANFLSSLIRAENVFRV